MKLSKEPRIWVGHWSMGLILHDDPRFGPRWWREYYFGPLVITNARRRTRWQKEHQRFIRVDWREHWAIVTEEVVDL